MVAGSKVEALGAEVAKLRRDLITTMDDANTAKENRVEKQLMLQKVDQLQAANQKVKSVSTKVVQAFHLPEEYNTVLFSWYYKGFELLRRYMVKHPFGVNLEELDFEEVDKEMEADEAAQVATALEENAPKSNILEPEDTLVDTAGGDEAMT